MIGNGRLETSERDEADSNREKIEALAEIICGAGDESAAALFVLMGIQNPRIPKDLRHGETFCVHSLR